MFIDTRALSGNVEIEADICIVGAGAAGIALARELGGGRLRIALIESGGFEFSVDMQALYEGDIVGQAFPPLSADRLRYFGGTTNHWDGSCRPFDPIDFEERPYAPHSGWPFDRTELDPFYSRAQEVCQLGRYSYAVADWETDKTPVLNFAANSRFQTGMFQNSPPTRFGEAYRQDLDRAAGTTVYLNANLVDIELCETGEQVTGLRLATLGGPHGRARAKFYVLATGGIENARLLLNANKLHKQGIGNSNDLVGRYFMDHPVVTNVATILFSEPHAAVGFYDLHKTRGQTVQGYLCLRPEAQRQEQLPTSCIGIQPSSASDRYFARTSLTQLWKSLKSGGLPDHLGFHLARIIEGMEGRTIDTARRWAHMAPSIFSTNYSCECPPDRESRVSLTEEIDQLGLRRIKLDWRLPSNFERNMRRAHEILGEELGHAGIGRLRLNAEAESNGMSAIENGHHHMGTTRMHTDPRQGVVNENCRLHEVGNLYIAGSSVFPTYSCDDPTMTIVALALRLADHLKSTFG